MKMSASASGKPRTSMTTVASFQAGRSSGRRTGIWFAVATYTGCVIGGSAATPPKLSDLLEFSATDATHIMDTWAAEADAIPLRMARRMDEVDAALAQAKRARGEEAKWVLAPPVRREYANLREYVKGMNRIEWFRSAVCNGTIGSASFWPQVDVCPRHRLDFLGTRQGHDNEKQFCAFDEAVVSHEDQTCTVLSVGSNNEWEFEEAVFARAPACQIRTFDLRPPESNPKLKRAPIQVPSEIEARTTLHPMWLGGPPLFGRKGRGRNAHTFPWSQFLNVSQTTSPTLAKVDCEGCELSWLLDVLDSGLAHTLPSQIDFELHDSRISGLSPHEVASSTPLEIHTQKIAAAISVLKRMWVEAGFAAIQLRPGDGGCEVLMARL